MPTTTTPTYVPFRALEARGWTKDMLQVHGFERASRGYSIRVAEQIETTAAWQEDRRRVEAGLPVLYRRKELLTSRPWSEAMITEFLPEPHLVVRIGTKRRMYLYVARQVEEIEATTRFRERAAAAAALSRKAHASAERKRQREELKERASLKVAQLLEGFTYSVLGDETLAEIVSLAKEDWEGDEQWRRATGRGDWIRPSDDRLAVDFLRHQRTAYDHQLGEVQHALWELEAEASDGEGENPLEGFFDELKNSAHAVIRAGTLDSIASAHPELTAAVAHRRSSNYTVVGGQPFRVGRLPVPSMAQPVGSGALAPQQVEALRLRVHVDAVSEAELEAAVRNADDRHRGDPDHADRLVVNYIRHERSNYEELLESPSVSSAVVKSAVLNEIAIAYPHLAGECLQQDPLRPPLQSYDYWGDERESERQARASRWDSVA